MPGIQLTLSDRSILTRVLAFPLDLPGCVLADAVDRFRWAKGGLSTMTNSESASLAYGHLRNAAWHYLSIDDDAGEALFLGATCLDVEDAFEKAEVIPAIVDDEGSAEQAIKAALASLDGGTGPLVPVLHDALVDLAVRAGVR